VHKKTKSFYPSIKHAATLFDSLETTHSNVNTLCGTTFCIHHTLRFSNSWHSILRHDGKVQNNCPQHFRTLPIAVLDKLQ